MMEIGFSDLCFVWKLFWLRQLRRAFKAFYFSRLHYFFYWYCLPTRAHVWCTIHRPYERIFKWLS